MKKLIIAISLVFVMAVGVIGGPVMGQAIHPSDPQKVDWSLLKDAIEQVCTRELGGVSRTYIDMGVVLTGTDEEDIIVFDSDDLGISGAKHFWITIDVKDIGVSETIEITKLIEGGGYANISHIYCLSVDSYIYEFIGESCQISYSSVAENPVESMRFDWGVKITYSK